MHAVSPSPVDGTRAVAYVMSRFPKLSETFILYEMEAVVAAGTPIELYPLLRERTSVMHPEAEAWCRRAHFLPFLSVTIVLSNERTGAEAVTITIGSR